jgi:predicted translin family RNA/ssDNA-binding protein
VDEKLLPFRSAVLLAKGALCDAQHELQAAQAKVEDLQRNLATHEAHLRGAEAALSEDKE